MDYKRVLSIQDMSCFGQCSLTVALPVISACGAETCVLPSALLSTHTSGFKGFTCLDLSDEMKKILAHWEEQSIYFDAVYTGYLANVEQIDIVKDVFATRLKPDGLRIVDPVMGDCGRLYPAFDDGFADNMRLLCKDADIILPNITEACLLTGTEYKDVYDEDYILSLLDKLTGLGAKKVVLTGVGFVPNTTGVFVYDGRQKYYYKHTEIPRSCHGTGDVFASAFTGAVMSGKTVEQAVKVSADFVVDCIRNTPSDGSHWYGVCFEKCIEGLRRSFKQ